MMSIIRTTAKLSIVTAIVAAIQPTTQSHAQDFVVYVSNVGTGLTCTVTDPCGAITNAMEYALNHAGTDTARVICLNPVTSDENSSPGSPGPNTTLEFDCPQSFLPALSILNQNTSATFRGVTFTRTGVNTALFDGASGTLVLEDCAFVNATGAAIDIEPEGPLDIVIKNCRLSATSGGAIILKPAPGGSITATLDHVTIADNAGGGIKIDTTNGPVTLDITDSVVSKNGGNGINAVGNAGGQAVVSIKNSVIAKNGAAGVQANGANAGVLVQTTLFDQNAAGATEVVNGGHISTYGNNSIVGNAGSGFTATAGLQ
jgi:hypothetical protein